MALKDKIEIPKYTLSEELINAISHGFGGLLSITALVLCVVSSAKDHNVLALISCIIYSVSSIILYTISCIYHSLKVNNGKRVFRILDHCSIYLLIAGTYTPYALVALPLKKGLIILIVNWSCAIFGIILNAINLKKYKKLSMVLYLIMGWMIIFSIKDLIDALSRAGLLLTFLAGVMYTVGAIFYGLGKKKKYMHSLFHFFVLAASILFFFAIYLYVI